MALQKQVNLYVAEGVPGMKATPDQSVFTVLNPLAAVDMPVAAFCFPVVTDGVIDYAHATNVAGDATEVLGFVERTIGYHNFDALSTGTLTVREGAALNVAIKGDYWAVCESDVAAGDTVLASTEDGSISTGDADSTHLDTGWKVKTAAEAGEPFIISAW